MNLLDFLFPKYCVNCRRFGDFLCADCFSRLSFETKNICVVCGKPSYDGLTHPRCIGNYTLKGSFTTLVYNSISKKLIYQFKYKPNLTGLKIFLGDLFYEALIQNEEFNKVLRQTDCQIILVPIPLNKSKLKKRGYNQAEILAKELSKKFGFPVINYLERIKDTKSQVKLSKEQRKKNIKGAFEIDNKYSANFKNVCVVLVDDVLTTGSTFSEAANVLGRCGVRQVWAVALAKED